MLQELAGPMIASTPSTQGKNFQAKRPDYPSKSSSKANENS